MRSAYLAATIFLVSLSCIYAQTKAGSSAEGRIVGTLIDIDGHPVGNAFVEAHEILLTSVPTQAAATEQPSVKDRPPGQNRKWLDEDISWISSGDPDAKTRQDGSFEIRGLTPGTYVLRGQKEEEAYPSSDLTLTDGSPAMVTLTPEVSRAYVVVKTGPKGGIVSGSITDKRTGQPIRAGMLVFRADNNQELLVSSEYPTIQFVMPAPVDLILVFSAHGYRPLRLQVHLEPDERQVLRVSMEPEIKIASTPPSVSAASPAR